MPVILSIIPHRQNSLESFLRFVEHFWFLIYMSRFRRTTEMLEVVFQSWLPKIHVCSRVPFLIIPPLDTDDTVKLINCYEINTNLKLMLKSSQVRGTQTAVPFAWTVWTLVVSFIIDLESTEGWKKSMSCLFRNISGSPWNALACCTQQWPVEWPFSRGRVTVQQGVELIDKWCPINHIEPVRWFEVSLKLTYVQHSFQIPSQIVRPHRRLIEVEERGKVIGSFRVCWYKRDVYVVLRLTFNPYTLF